MPIKKLSQKQLIMIGAGVVLVVVIFLLIFLNLRPKANTVAQAKITVWGTDESDGLAALVSGYPYGQAAYTHIDPETYQSQLLSALASGRGPDVFEIGNRTLPKWKSVTAPLPTPLSQQFGILQLQNLFPDVVMQDFVSDGQIYGLPLSIDTLVAIYNKDLLNSAGIALPPKTWNEFQDDVVKLRVVNDQGQLTHQAAAIGGSGASIPYAADLLSLLMLQNGTEMTDQSHNGAKFASPANGAPGPAAFNFYLQFANAVSPYYTWNDGIGNAVDSFAAGQTAIIFGYQSDLAALKERAPFLNLGVAAMPQAKGASVAVNYPRYNAFVAAKTGQTAAAWNFILYLTATSGDGKMYQKATGKPPALRADIQADMNDPGLSIFASQALTARSWYEADDPQIAAVMSRAIQNVLSGTENSLKALQEAETAVSQLMFRAP